MSGRSSETGQKLAPNLRTLRANDPGDADPSGNGLFLNCNCKLFAIRLSPDHTVAHSGIHDRAASFALAPRAHSSPTPDEGWRRAPQHPVAVGGVRHHPHAADRADVAGSSWPSWARAIWSPSATWTRATGRPRSRAARSSATRCSPSRSCPTHGDPAAGAVRAARHRRRPRSGAGLPRRLSARGVVAAVGARPRSRSAPPISPR